MVVEAMTDFRDLEAQTHRRAGERFEASEERYKAINGTKYGQLVREVEETKPRRTRRTKE